MMMMQPPTEATLQSLTIAVDLTAPAKGETIIATATGHYSDSTTKDLTAQVTWASTDPAVLESVADQPGHFLVKTMGVAQITVALGNVHGMQPVTAGDRKVASLAIIPNSKEIGLGGHAKVDVVATYSDQTQETVTKDPGLTWETSNFGVLVASGTDKGYLVTFGQGSATITAKFGGVMATGDYVVGPARMDYMIITPKNTRIDMMNPVQFHAQGYWSDQSTHDVTSQVTWTSSDPTIAVIDANGLATAVGDGMVVISASQGDVSAMTVARTVTSNCPYPEDALTTVQYDRTLPGMFWLDAFVAGGAQADFQVANTYCDATTHPTIVFAVSAGWCPYCPDYMAMVDSLTPQLEEEGAIVVFVVIETSGGAPAMNDYANTLISGETMNLGHSIRVGDGETAGAVNLPFSGAVQALPSAFVVRTRDMHVIASQDRSETYLDLLSIVRDPERLY
jgi:thiol-disulfide isomerase/thioredoxin